MADHDCIIVEDNLSEDRTANVASAAAVTSLRARADRGERPEAAGAGVVSTSQRREDTYIGLPTIAGPSVYVPRSRPIIVPSDHVDLRPEQSVGTLARPMAAGLSVVRRSQEQVAAAIHVGTPTSSLLLSPPATPCMNVSTPVEMTGDINDTVEEAEKDSPTSTGSSKQLPTWPSKSGARDHLLPQREGAVNPTITMQRSFNVGVARPCTMDDGLTTFHVAQRKSSSLPHAQRKSLICPEAIVDPVQIQTTGSATAASSASTHHHPQRSFSEGISRPNTIRRADSGTAVQPLQSSLPGNWPESPQLPTEANNNPVPEIQRASSAPVASQKRLVTVDADVLDQVVKFAAISCQLTMPDRGSLEEHEKNLYKMLRGDIGTPQGEKNVDRPYEEKNNDTPQEEGSTDTHRSSESLLLKGLLAAPANSSVDNTNTSVGSSTISGTCSSISETTSHSGHGADNTSINCGSIVDNTTIYSQTKTISTTKGLSESVEVQCSLSSSTPTRRTNSKRPNPNTDPDVIVIGDESPPEQKKLKLSQENEQIKTTSAFEVGRPNSSTHIGLLTAASTSNSTSIGLPTGEKAFDKTTSQTQRNASLFQSRTNKISSDEEPPREVLRLSVNEGETTSGTCKSAYDNVYTAVSANIGNKSDVILQPGESPAISQLLSLSNLRRENSGVESSLRSQSQTGPTSLSRFTDYGASSESSVEAGPSTSATVRSKRKKRVRCGKCANCLLPSCGQCKYCL